MTSFADRLATARARERWVQVYREAPEVFRAFEDAEDPDGLAAARLRQLAETDGRRVLELGCGTGWLTRRLAPTAGAYVALDASASMLGLHEAADGAAGEGADEGVAEGVAGSNAEGNAGTAARTTAGTTAEIPAEATAESSAPAARPRLLRARAQRLPLASASVDRVVASWLLLDLRPEPRRAALAEALRVLRPGGSLWVIENHGTGAYQELRDLVDPDGLGEARPLVDELGLALREVVHTELRFDDAAEAGRVLGAILGAAAAERHAREPHARIGLDIGLFSLAKGS